MNGWLDFYGEWAERRRRRIFMIVIFTYVHTMIHHHKTCRETSLSYSIHFPASHKTQTITYILNINIDLRHIVSYYPNIKLPANNHIPSRLPSYLATYLPTYLPTYLRIITTHWQNSFQRFLDISVTVCTYVLACFIHACLPRSTTYIPTLFRIVLMSS